MENIDYIDVFIRLAAATICGGVLGWEREAHNKPAGLRTNMLVAIGAAVATMATVDLVAEVDRKSHGEVSADPVRVIAGVIGGLGFLGAGAIIQSRGEVQGMTTAAAIWVVGGIGVACGLGNFKLALPAVFVAFVVLFALGRFQNSRFASRIVGVNGSARNEPQDARQTAENP